MASRSRTAEPREREVVIVYKSLPHYRTMFYEQLRVRLRQHGVNLRLIVGQPDSADATRRDTAHIEWAEVVRNRYLRVGRRSIVWQPVLRRARSADAVVVEQASKLLVNYLLLAWQRIGGPKVAWWGHGINLDADKASDFGEWVKSVLTGKAAWWFCYTERTASIVRRQGVSGDRLTVVQNAIDTASMQAQRAAMTDSEIQGAREGLGLSAGPTALYLGSLYDRKRPEFMVEAADVIRCRIPDFQLVVIGDGPDRKVIESAAATREWIRFLGPLMGADLVRAASTASLICNPGLVGLTILDSFALGLPMVTCDLPYHSPEVDYLESDVNGIVLPRATTPTQYAQAVADLLNDGARLAQLQAAGRASAQVYTVEEMSRRFAEGLLAMVAECTPTRPVSLGKVSE